MWLRSHAPWKTSLWWDTSHISGCHLCLPDSDVLQVTQPRLYLLLLLKPQTDSARWVPRLPCQRACPGAPVNATGRPLPAQTVPTLRRSATEGDTQRHLRRRELGPGFLQLRDSQAQPLSSLSSVLGSHFGVPAVKPLLLSFPLQFST